ncbi:L,D-transpeptidase [Actinophytocola sp.]|uniref:L,D-transpeptidase n=1 Tax=Actinophytocola sp. TaxID=1872138 RepID=UPI00389AF0BB
MGKLRKMAGVAAGSAALGVAALLALPATAQAAPGVPCSARADACVDLSANTTWLMHNGVVTYGGVPITSGKPGHETPTGTFHVTYKDIDHYSRAYNGPMPYSVFFTNTGVAFHQGSLGVQSHGCVHLSHDAAVTYYNTLHPGDVVEVVE